MGDEQSKRVRTLREDIDLWLAGRNVSWIVQDEMRGFVYDGVQLSVTVDIDARQGFVLLGAIVLTALERGGGPTLEDLQTCLDELPDSPPIALAIGSPNHTIWACEGFELDEFDADVFWDVVDELVAYAVPVGHEVRARVGGGILGTEARVSPRRTPTDGGRADLRERRALQHEEDLARLLEYRLRMPRGSLQVTRAHPTKPRPSPRRLGS